jgi:acyl-CoA thioesterase YciA
MERSTDQKEPCGKPTTRILAVSADANPSGGIFRRPGAAAQGHAAGMAAGAGAQECVAIDTMRFLCPVRIGGVLCVDTTIEQVGHTSMPIRLRAWALRGPDE